MGYLPIFLALEGRSCAVIGGDDLAAAKVRVLLDAGAVVTVLSPEAVDEIKLWAEAGRLHYFAREYQYGDLRSQWLAYITTQNAQLARQAADEARELGTLLNVVDHPESSNFISPATFRRGDLQIAISTGGASPAVARMIRERLEQQFGAEYALLLAIVRKARRFLRSRQPNQRKRAAILRFVASALLAEIGNLNHSLIDRTLKLYLDAGVAELGLDRELREHSTMGTGQ